MLGPTGHIDTFTRDRLPAAEDWPVIDTSAFPYPDWLNVGVELSDRMVERGFGDHVALIGNGRSRTYKVEGQIFFASADDFLAAFDFREVLERVTIDVSAAHIWDISSVAALDTIVLKFRREGAEVDIVGLNQASETIVDRLATHDKPGALERPAGH